MSEKKFPLFMGEDGKQIQIGEVVLKKLSHESDALTHVMFDIDVFPGERLTASRLVEWNDVLQISELKYPRRQA